MKTTVKEFILDNLTDKNFEKLVNMLIMEKVRYYYYFDGELINNVDNYLSEQTPFYPKDNTFEVINEIKKVSTHYKSDYRDALIIDELQDLEKLNDTATSWMPTKNKTEEIPKKVIDTLPAEIANLSDEPLEIGSPLESVNNDLDDELEVPNDDPAKINSVYHYIQDINIAFTTDTYTGYQKNDLTDENYQAYVLKEKNQTALALVNFIYEVLHYTNESRYEHHFKEFSNEASLIKITDDNKYMDGYGVQFLLDNRTRYVSDHIREAYYKRNESMDGENEEKYGYYGMPFYHYPEEPPRFVEYVEIMEDLQMEQEFILAPFTFYLNEELQLPVDANGIRYEILEQIVHLLTLQGFNKEEQISSIYSSNRDFENRVL